MILMMILILIAAFLSLLLAVVLYQSLRLRRLRRRASISDVAAWVGTLLRSFAPGSILIAEPNGNDGFLQFALTQRDEEWRALEFGLPEMDWSRAKMAEVQALLDSAGVSWTVEAGGLGANIQHFLRAEFAGERACVVQRVSSLVPRLAAALGHSVHQTYHVRLLGHDAPEYERELAEKLEALPMAGRLEKKIAVALRGRTDHH